MSFSMEGKLRSKPITKTGTATEVARLIFGTGAIEGRKYVSLEIVNCKSVLIHV